MSRTIFNRGTTYLKQGLFLPLLLAVTALNNPSQLTSLFQLTNLVKLPSFSLVPFSTLVPLCHSKNCPFDHYFKQNYSMIYSANKVAAFPSKKAPLKVVLLKNSFGCCRIEVM